MRIVYLTYQRGTEWPDGHEVLYRDINDIDNRGTEVVLKEIVDFKPDLIFEREWNDGKALYMPLLYLIKDALPNVIRAKHFIDTHVAEKLHLMYAKYIDVGFFAISGVVPKFKKLLGESNAFWLPLCYPDRRDTIHPNYNPVKYPVSFVGRFDPKWFSKRAEYVHQLKEYFHDRFYAVTDYENMRTIVKQSKVAFNHSINGDLNFRVFEVLGLGTELVTDSVDDLYKIKGLKDRLSIYGDVGDCIGFIARILSDDPKVTHNSLQNQEWIRENHCLYHRHTQLLQMLEERKQFSY